MIERGAQLHCLYSSALTLAVFLVPVDPQRSFQRWVVGYGALLLFSCALVGEFRLMLTERALVPANVGVVQRNWGLLVILLLASIAGGVGLVWAGRLLVKGC